MATSLESISRSRLRQSGARERRPSASECDQAAEHEDRLIPPASALCELVSVTSKCDADTGFTSLHFTSRGGHTLRSTHAVPSPCIFPPLPAPARPRQATAAPSIYFLPRSAIILLFIELSIPEGAMMYTAALLCGLVARLAWAQQQVQAQPQGASVAISGTGVAPFVTRTVGPVGFPGPRGLCRTSLPPNRPSSPVPSAEHRPVCLPQVLRLSQL